MAPKSAKKGCESMKSIKKTGSIKARIVSAVVSLALILCAVLSFGFVNIDKNKVYAEDETSDSGIRFVQIAAGADFAIGLTFDGELYGWSLNAENSTYVGKGGLNQARTLGEYYSTVPTKLVDTKDSSSYDYVFRNGPGIGSSLIKWGSTDYHNPRTSSTDRITQIAATRTSAAFVTAAGYIYTWGTNPYDANIKNEESYKNYLLLRQTDDVKYPWYKPYIIDYGYGVSSDPNNSDVEAALKNVVPGDNFGNVSLAASEYNYIIVYSKGTAGNYYSYVWGSLMYAVPNIGAKSNYTLSIGGTDTLFGGAGKRRVYKTQFTTGNTASVTAVAGGYNVGINAVVGSGDSLVEKSTSLVLRGRNFVQTQVSYQTDNELSLTPVSPVTTNSRNYTLGTGTSEKNGLASISYTQLGNTYTINNSIIGGTYASEVSGNSGMFEPNGGSSANADLYYGRQAVGSSDSSFQYATDINKDFTVKNALGNVINGSASSFAQTRLYDVSLGNDMGYGISDGKLYAWGANGQGQNGLNDTLAVRSVPTKVSGLNTALENSATGTSDKFVSVAAGRQLSNTSKPFHADSATFENNGTTVTTSDNKINFSDTVKSTGALAGGGDLEDYITGAITDKGKLYVWSNNKPEFTEIKFGDAATPNDYNKFAAVYSGYGNHLFAVTRLGKVVHITYKDGDYVKSIYDEFETSLTVSGNAPSANWTVDIPQQNGDVNNNIKFRSQKIDDENEPDLGRITLYVDSGYASQPSVYLNDRHTATGAGKLDYFGDDRKSLVMTNKTGDVYRILDYGFDGSISCLDGTTTPVRELLKPKFYFNGSTTAMTEKQQQNMFSYKIVYNRSNGIGIEITPLRSTKGGNVTVKFYVARYDCAKNFEIVSDTSPTNANTTIDSRSGVVNNTALLYDYKECTVKFEIENTEAYLSFNSFRDAIADGTANASMPLLDPNNSDNNKYSVAVQNVSDGVTALVDYLMPRSASKDNFVNAIVGKMKEQDIGFPAEEHISKGNLNYYLGATEAARAYGNKYLYLFTDRDGDLVRITNNAKITMQPIRNAPITAVDGTYKQITISLSTAGYSLDSDAVAKLKTDFDNVFGIYDIKVENNTLEFKYDIAFFEAKDSTGSLAYSGTTPDSYSTVNSAPNAFLNVTVNAVEYSKYNADYVPDTTATDAASRKTLNKQAAAAVFTQPTVRIKNNETIYGSARPNDGYEGDAAVYKNTHRVVRSLGVGDTLEIKLSEFIKAAGSYIHFSYNNLINATSYTAFNNQFIEDGHGVVTLDESGSSIFVSPIKRHNINFTVSVQRFYGGVNNTAFAGGNEKVEISFLINVNDDGIKNFKMHEGANTSYKISKASKIDLMGGGDSINNQLIDLDVKYKDAVVISDLRSADTSILTVSPSGGSEFKGTSFTVTPVSSGTTFVQFVASVYDKPTVITLTFEVSGLTVLNDEIQLIDTKYIAVDLLINSLRQANDFNDDISRYTVLSKDVDAETGRSNAVYFTDADGKELKAENGYPNGYPKFIQSVSFVDTDTSHPRIRIVPDNDQTETTGVYNMRVRFVRDDFTSYADARESNVAVLETSQKISSTRMIIPYIDDPEDENDEHKGGSVYTVWIDVDHITDGHRSDSGNTSSNWMAYGSNTETVVHVPIQQMLAAIGNETPEDFKIFLVSSTSDATSYFNYSYDTDATNVVITPLYNTPDPITVNVSVSKTTAGSDVRLMLAFRVSIDGISTSLTKDEYTIAWIVAFFSSLGVLIIIFLIRMIVYWRKRAKQRAIIKRNQELIKMRDRMHNKATAASREQIVKTKLKMEDPKYAKMFNDMRKEKENESGITLENSAIASTAKTKASKKKKKGGKKSLAELKAELEAKKAAFAQVQNGEAVNPFVGEVPIDNQGFDGQGFGDLGGQDFGGQDFGSPVDAFTPQDLDGNAIIFDAPDPNDGMQG